MVVTDSFQGVGTVQEGRIRGVGREAPEDQGLRQDLLGHVPVRQTALATRSEGITEREAAGGLEVTDDDDPNYPINSVPSASVAADDDSTDDNYETVTATQMVMRRTSARKKRPPLPKVSWKLVIPNFDWQKNEGILRVFENPLDIGVESSCDGQLSKKEEYNEDDEEFEEIYPPAEETLILQSTLQ